MHILLADGDTTTRFALCTLLEQHPGWLVVGEVSSADQLPGQVEAVKPDVMLLDWNFPELKAEKLITSLQEDFPKLSIIVLSGRPEFKIRACAAGADAFVSKADPPDRLINAIAAINSGMLD